MRQDSTLTHLHGRDPGDRDEVTRTNVGVKVNGYSLLELHCLLRCIQAKSLLQPRANGSKLDEKKEFHEWRVPKNTPVNDP
jgi:hypothetical protein